MSKIDLHVHSMYSDGTNSPKELVDMAVSIGLRAMALTDHDTIDGVPHAIEAARDYDITIIPGVEISTFYQEGEIHIIGLFVDYNNREFVAELDQMRIEREDRNRLMCSRLRKYGIDIDYDKLVDIYKSHAITRAHFADFLYKNGYVSGRNRYPDQQHTGGSGAFPDHRTFSDRRYHSVIGHASSDGHYVRYLTGGTAYVSISDLPAENTRKKAVGFSVAFPFSDPVVYTWNFFSLREYGPQTKGKSHPGPEPGYHLLLCNNRSLSGKPGSYQKRLRVDL